MEDAGKKMNVETGDKEILYSRAIKAGKRIYYLDVKRNLKDDLFLAITESKKVQSKEGAQAIFEKHKIFLYKEDFEKFIEGLSDVIGYIQQHNGDVSTKPANSNDPEENDTSDSGDIKLTIDF